MKKNFLLTVVLILVLTFTSFSCAEAGRIFVDSAGRIVSVPNEITRVAVTGGIAQYMLLAVAPELMIATATPWSKEEEKYISSEYRNLPCLGQLYGGKGTLNLESLLAVAPDIVLDVGDPKECLANDMNELSKQTGIPFIHIDATLFTYDQAFELLGNLLSRSEKAQKLADYCRRICERTLAIAESGEKPTFLYVSGIDGLSVIAADSYHSEVIDLLSDNLAVVGSPSAKGTGNEVDMEQILNWNPDTMVFASENFYNAVENDETWQFISAVEKGRYCLVPYGPQNWMGFPPSCQRLLGMSWMAKILYPELAGYDLYNETAEYYELFYHQPLSREQYESITKKAFFKE